MDQADPTPLTQEIYTINTQVSLIDCNHNYFQLDGLQGTFWIHGHRLLPYDRVRVIIEKVPTNAPHALPHHPRTQDPS